MNHVDETNESTTIEGTSKWTVEKKEPGFKKT